MSQKQKTTTNHSRFTEQEVRESIQKLLANAKKEKSLSQQDIMVWQLLLKNLHEFFDSKRANEVDKSFQFFEKHYASILFPEGQKISSNRTTSTQKRRYQNQRG